MSYRTVITKIHRFFNPSNTMSITIAMRYSRTCVSATHATYARDVRGKRDSKITGNRIIAQGGRLTAASLWNSKHNVVCIDSNTSC